MTNFESRLKSLQKMIGNRVEIMRLGDFDPPHEASWGREFVYVPIPEYQVCLVMDVPVVKTQPTTVHVICCNDSHDE